MLLSDEFSVMYVLRTEMKKKQKRNTGFFEISNPKEKINLMDRNWQMIASVFIVPLLAVSSALLISTLCLHSYRKVKVKPRM